MITGQEMLSTSISTRSGRVIPLCVIMPANTPDNIKELARQQHKWEQVASDYRHRYESGELPKQVAFRATFASNVLWQAANMIGQNEPGVWIALSDGDILGIIIHSHRPGNKIYVDYAAIAPQYHPGAPSNGDKPKGIGTSMLEAIRQEAQGQNASELILHSLDEQAFKFWQSHGFSDSLPGHKLHATPSQVYCYVADDPDAGDVVDAGEPSMIPGFTFPSSVRSMSSQHEVVKRYETTTGRGRDGPVVAELDDGTWQNLSTYKVYDSFDDLAKEYQPGMRILREQRGMAIKSKELPVVGETKIKVMPGLERLGKRGVAIMGRRDLPPIVDKRWYSRGKDLPWVLAHEIGHQCIYDLAKAIGSQNLGSGDVETNVARWLIDHGVNHSRISFREPTLALHANRFVDDINTGRSVDHVLAGEFVAEVVAHYITTYNESFKYHLPLEVENVIKAALETPPYERSRTH